MILIFIPTYDPKVQGPAVYCPKETSLEPNHCEIKDCEDSARRNTFLSFLSQKKKKEALQENICYYLSQRFKVEIRPLCELAKELTGGRC